MTSRRLMVHNLPAKLMPAKLMLAALACALSCWPVQAYDLTKIQRALAKEPTYQASPRYCLLVFGPTAETRVWLVVDGDTMYVDRNGNGDVTEPGEKVQRNYSFTLGDIVERDGHTVHKNLRVILSGDRYRIHVTSNRLGRQMAGFGQDERVSFASSAKNAPIIHFDGPLSIGQYSTMVTLPRKIDNKSHRITSLRIKVGTPGLGEGTFAACHCACRHKLGPLHARFEYAVGNINEGKKRNIEAVLQTFN